MSINLQAFLPVQVIVAGKSFTYKLAAGMSVAVRQPVVVDFGAKGLTVGIVESVNQYPLDPNAKFKYKWIVQAIDRSAYDAILAAESGKTVVEGAAPRMADMLYAANLGIEDASH